MTARRRADASQAILMQVSNKKIRLGEGGLTNNSTSYDLEDKPTKRDRIDQTKSSTVPKYKTLALGAVIRAIEVEKAYGHIFLWIPVGLIFGAAFNYSRAENIPDIAILALIAILSLPVILGSRAIGQYARYLTNFLLCCAVGMLLANFEMKGSVILLDQAVTTEVKGVVLSHDIDDKDIIRYVLLLQDTQNPTIRRPPKRVQLVARSKHAHLKVGDIISGRARLTPPSGPVFPGGFDFAFHAMNANIGAYGFFMGKPQLAVNSGISSGAQTTNLPLSVQYQTFINQLRATIAYRIRHVLDGDQGAIASALTVAKRKAISANTVDALRQSGLAHILAISGLHMVLAAGTLFFTLRAGLVMLPSVAQMFAVKKIAAGGAILAATFYLLLSGAPISAQRAWIMLVIMLLAIVLDRPVLTLRNVAIAAIIIVALTPAAVLTPGFQMSFAAVAALVSVYQGWKRIQVSQEGIFLPDILRWIGVKFFFILLAPAITAFIAGLASGIFSIQHFYAIASLGVLANVLAMPIVTFLIMPLALISLLLMPFGLETWTLLGLGVAIEQVIKIASFVTNLSGEVNVGKPSQLATWLLTLGFIGFVCIKTSARYACLALIPGAMFMVWLMPLTPPNILISEDGRLAAIISSEGIKVSRSRPSEFIISQWEEAYIGKRRPAQYPLSRADAKEILSLDAEDFWSVLREKVPDMGRENFDCLNVNFCVFQEGAGHDQLTIITLGQADYLSYACQHNHKQGQYLWVMSFRLDPKDLDCPSHPAIKFDQNKLRRTGSIAIYVSAPLTEKDQFKFNIQTAINDHVRPWTVQRYYDWRYRNYQFPSGDIKPLASR